MLNKYPSHICSWQLTIISLIVHFCRVLYREAGSESACAVLTQLLGRRLFFVTVQCAIMVLAAVGLTLLAAEQVSNIVRNTVRSILECPIYDYIVVLKLFVYYMHT